MASERVIPSGFYVYTHARPDGSVFYIGKGSGRRAWDFAPRRRTKHHRNIAVKYGLQNIIVTVRPCESEAAAFALEREWISDFRLLGVQLINLTEGGEGASGRRQSAASREAFKKCYGPNRILTPEGRQRILEGLARGRENKRARILTPEDHARRSAAAKKASQTRLAKPGIQKVCAQCLLPFEAKNPHAIYCHKRCGVRASRARALAINGKPPPKPLGPRSSEGRAAVARAQKERWARKSEAEREAWKAKMRPGRQAANERRRLASQDRRGLSKEAGLPADPASPI